MCPALGCCPTSRAFCVAPVNLLSCLPSHTSPPPQVYLLIESGAHEEALKLVSSPPLAADMAFEKVRAAAGPQVSTHPALKMPGCCSTNCTLNCPQPRSVLCGPRVLNASPLPHPRHSPASNGFSSILPTAGLLPVPPGQASGRSDRPAGCACRAGAGATAAGGAGGSAGWSWALCGGVCRCWRTRCIWRGDR